MVASVVEGQTPEWKKFVIGEINAMKPILNPVDEIIPTAWHLHVPQRGECSHAVFPEGAILALRINGGFYDEIASSFHEISAH